MAMCRRCSRVIVCTTQRVGSSFMTSNSKRTMQSRRRLFTKVCAFGGAAALTSVAAYITYDRISSRRFLSSHDSNSSAKVLAKEPENAVDRTLLQRESRFRNFASVEFDGNVYMTPLDFLESITEENPRPQMHRRHLRQSEVEKYLKNTPLKKKGTSRLFRNLIDHGIISYTEYLFLLCVLTKPRSGFQIAFNMFDTDGDQKVDKKEFLVLEHLMASSGSSRSSTTREGGRSGEPLNDTTLTVHFFGQKGADVLNYEDFHRFMDNLQTEILELEFLEFSHGMPTIKEEEFARILLRYTILTKEQHEEYLERLRKRIMHDQGIAFSDFKEFCQFLNNLDDFALALRIYTYADHPISEVDFKRAVKACTGQILNSHLVHVVFQLFDEDGDGKLSHKEFISVMKERLHRGAKIAGQNYWKNFKNCVKNEVRSS